MILPSLSSGSRTVIFTNVRQLSLVKNELFNNKAGASEDFELTFSTLKSVYIQDIMEPEVELTLTSSVDNEGPTTMRDLEAKGDQLGKQESRCFQHVDKQLTVAQDTDSTHYDLLQQSKGAQSLLTNGFGQPFYFHGSTTPSSSHSKLSPKRLEPDKFTGDRDKLEG